MVVRVSAAVEGDVDEAILRRIFEAAGIELGAVYGKRGKSALLSRLRSYNEAARHAPWVVLVDLDHDAECAPPARVRWLPGAAPHMCFRIAVRAVEAWLMADRPRIAHFLGVPRARIPIEPDRASDPKELMIQLARSSHRRLIRESLVPRDGSGAKIGPTYVSSVIQFVEDKAAGWRPREAAETSKSLARCIKCLARFRSRVE